MSLRRSLFVLLLAFTLLAAPASFAAEQANPAGLWHVFASWLWSSLGLGDELEGGYGFIPGGQPHANQSPDQPELGVGIIPGGQPHANQSPDQPELGVGIEPGG